MKYTRRSNNFLCISIALCVGGLCLIVSRPIIGDCLLSLECNPLLFNMWKNVAYDVYVELYLFNWTNPEDLHNMSVKPRFEEIGPFVFQLDEEKWNIVWNNNGTVTFQQRRFWYFKDNERSSLDKKVTNVDVIFLGISYATRNWNYYVRKGVFLTLSTYFPKIYRTQTARDLLFDGYPEPVLGIVSAMPFFKHLEVPRWNRFGWLYSRNGSSECDGVFNVGTGRNSVLGKMYNWNYQSRTGYFEGDCGKVSGSASQMYPRNLVRGEPIEIFSTDLRRTIFLKYVEDEYVEGILGYRYTATNYTMDNGTIDAKNKCFCPDECIPFGMMNLSSTRHTAPIFVSLPHFYTADPYYINLVDGLKPDETAHDSWMIVEPITGTILKTGVKIQVNVLMQPVTGTGTQLFENVRKLFVPMVWMNFKTTIPFKGQLFVKIVLIVLPGITCLGVIMIITAAFLLWYERRNDPRRLQSLSQVQLRENRSKS